LIVVSATATNLASCLSRFIVERALGTCAAILFSSTLWLAAELADGTGFAIILGGTFLLVAVSATATDLANFLIRLLVEHAFGAFVAIGGALC